MNADKRRYRLNKSAFIGVYLRFQKLISYHISPFQPCTCHFANLVDMGYCVFKLLRRKILQFMAEAEKYPELLEFDVYSHET